MCIQVISSESSFNTQPPEGGWQYTLEAKPDYKGFNTQPPEGGWVRWFPPVSVKAVSTHSRLKAAGYPYLLKLTLLDVSTHSRLKAAGPSKQNTQRTTKCFNTQPPEGGWYGHFAFLFWGKCFNTQPPEGGWCSIERPSFKRA